MEKRPNSQWNSLKKVKQAKRSYSLLLEPFPLKFALCFPVCDTQTPQASTTSRSRGICLLAMPISEACIGATAGRRGPCRGLSHAQPCLTQVWGAVPQNSTFFCSFSWSVKSRSRQWRPRVGHTCSKKSPPSPPLGWGGDQELQLFKQVRLSEASSWSPEFQSKSQSKNRPKQTWSDSAEPHHWWWHITSSPPAAAAAAAAGSCHPRQAVSEWVSVSIKVWLKVCPPPSLSSSTYQASQLMWGSVDTERSK